MSALKAHKVCMLAFRKPVIHAADIDRLYPNIPQIIRQFILHLAYGIDSPIADRQLRSQVNNILIANYAQKDRIIKRIGKKYSAGFLPNTVFSNEFSKYGRQNHLFIYKIIDQQFVYEINRLGLSIFHSADSEVFIVKRTPKIFPLFFQESIQINENVRKRFEKHYERLIGPLEIMYKGQMNEALQYFKASRTWPFVFYDLPAVPGLIRDEPFLFSPAPPTEYRKGECIFPGL